MMAHFPNAQSYQIKGCALWYIYGSWMDPLTTWTIAPLVWWGSHTEGFAEELMPYVDCRALYCCQRKVG